MTDIRQFVTNRSSTNTPTSGTPVNTTTMSTPVNHDTFGLPLSTAMCSTPDVNADRVSIPVNCVTCNAVTRTSTCSAPANATTCNTSAATATCSASNSCRVVPQFVRDQLATMFPNTSPVIIANAVSQSSDLAEAIDLLLSSSRRGIYVTHKHHKYSVKCQALRRLGEGF